MFSNGVECVLNLPLCNVRSLNKEFRGKVFNFFFPEAFFIMEAISIKSKTIKHTSFGFFFFWISIVARCQFGMHVHSSE